jgi:predicted Fe-Mo cluster-binding NifX family protein
MGKDEMPKQIAISVTGKDGLQSQLDPRFGRAAGFLIVDPVTRSIIAEIPNRAADQVQGAGTAAAKLMKDNKVAAVISGRFGPKAFQALSALGIEMWVAPDGISADEALRRLEAGTLERMAVQVY